MHKLFVLKDLVDGGRYLIRIVLFNTAFIQLVCTCFDEVRSFLGRTSCVFSCGERGRGVRAGRTGFSDVLPIVGSESIHRFNLSLG